MGSLGVRRGRGGSGRSRSTTAAAGAAIGAAAAAAGDTTAAAVAAGLSAAQAAIAVAAFNGAAAAAAGGTAAQVSAGAQTIAFGYIKPDIQARGVNSSFVQASGRADALKAYFDRFLFNCDQWDGFNAERKALMAHLKGGNIRNVVALTGDLHCFDAGVVMDDYDATRAIRTLPGWAQRPIVALTANALAEDRRACIEAGMNDFLVEPVPPAALLQAVLRWLAAKAPPAR